MQGTSEPTDLSNMRGLMHRTRMVMHTMHSWWAPWTPHPWPQCPCRGANKFLVEGSACREDFPQPGDSTPGYTASREQISSANLSGVSSLEMKEGFPLRVSSRSKNHPVSVIKRRRHHEAVSPTALFAARHRSSGASKYRRELYSSGALPPCTK